MTSSARARRALLAALILATCRGSPAPSTLAITGATLIDVRDGSRLANTAIVIEGDRIVAVGPMQSTRIPSGAQVVDGHGKYVIPGLWDLHTHINNQRELDAFFPLLRKHGQTSPAYSVCSVSDGIEWIRHPSGAGHSGNISLRGVIVFEARIAR
ncbi:MAG: hypothetical protein Q7S40_05975 [Opitutaceae bacterium]|nr:hypothetical protein [Opitutaceae bacterium]